MSEWLKADFWENTLAAATNWVITSAPTILVILILAFVLLRILRYALLQLQTFMVRRTTDPSASAEETGKRVVTLTDIVRRTTKILIWGIVAILILRELGVEVAPLIAGAGIAGLAVGFGAQNLVRDVIGGFFLILENQVRTGDVAVINGTGGLVESINLRTITLRDLSGVVHIFANGNINTLSNMTKGWSAMVFEIGVAYKEDPEQVMDIMRKVSAELQLDSDFKSLILEPMEIFGVESFGDSAVIIKARIKTTPIKQWFVGREYRRRLKKAFDDQGIEIPFPHRSLYAGEDSKPLRILVENATGSSGAASGSPGGKSS